MDDLAGIELGPRVELEASESIHAVGDRPLVPAAECLDQPPTLPTAVTEPAMTRTSPAAINRMAVSGPGRSHESGAPGSRRRLAPRRPSLVADARLLGIWSDAAEALPGDHVDAREDEDRDRIAKAEDGAGHGLDAEDAEAEDRQTEGDQPAGDAADEEDHQQPEHLPARPAPADGDRLADPEALDDDERPISANRAAT